MNSEYCVDSSRDGGVLFQVGGGGGGGEIGAEGAKHIGGSGGMVPRKILKSRVSEMPFPALWGQNL